MNSDREQRPFEDHLEHGRPVTHRERYHHQEEERASSVGRGPKKPHQLSNIMMNLKGSLGMLQSQDSERIMSCVSDLVDYYQFHVTKLKSLVKEKQAALSELQTVNIPSLQSEISLLQEELALQKRVDKEQMNMVEDSKMEMLNKEKEISRLRVLLEEEKRQTYNKRRVEQDFQEDSEKLKREIYGLKELGTIKDDEITYLKKNLRSLEEETIDLRDQKRELVLKIDRLQSHPIQEEKMMLEKSSKYLVDQINSLKRELYKAKSVVETYKQDRELDRQERASQRFERASHHSFDPPEPQFAGDHGEEDPDRLNSSYNLDNYSRRSHSRNRRSFAEEKNPGMAHSFVPDPKKETDVVGFRRRPGHINERRHQNLIAEEDPSSRHTAMPSINTASVGNLPHNQGPRDPLNRNSHDQQPPSYEARRDPNRGNGNILASNYPDEDRPKYKDKFGFGGSRLDSAKKAKLREDIGDFYCRL